VKKLLASVAVLGVVFGVFNGAAAAQELRIGVVDLRKVVLESKPGQAHRAERDKMVKERRDKLTKEEQSVRAMQEKLEKEKLTLTDKQQEQKRKEIADKIAALQKEAQEAQQEVSQRDSEALKKADVLLHAIVIDIAKQEKLTMVVDRNQPGLVWINEPVDITDKVLKAYEAKAGK
jgi:outer membrane protein